MIRNVDIENENLPNWLFIVRKINISHQDYDESSAHQHKYYQFLFFEKGGGVHIIDDQEYEVKPNSIHFISPNHVHYLKITKATKGYVCMFKKELFFINNESENFLEGVDLLSNWNKNPIVEFDDVRCEEMVSVMELLCVEYEEHQNRKYEVILMFLKVFLIKASRLHIRSQKVSIGSKERLIAQFLGLVEKNHNAATLINFYAQEMGITSVYLNRIVKEKYNKSVSDFINEKTILEAKRILQFSSDSVKEIAFQLGFEDPSYFSRFFKNHSGFTPLSYRKKVLEK
ncbi:MAG: helix-turn-helix transcriptional regulator [Flavobacteriales bacterium]|nr:helix-turn-helix transcriptional regulator [Flavobacteriales bacterium]